ncbi:unnamed protein product, partial [Clonostachys chloroleuca]
MPRTGDQTSKSAGGIKIINASLFRMGTKSMAEAYTILGYRTHHAIDDPVTVPWGLIEEAAEGKWPDVPGARARRPFTRSDWGAIWGSYDHRLTRMPSSSSSSGISTRGGTASNRRCSGGVSSEEPNLW